MAELLPVQGSRFGMYHVTEGSKGARLLFQPCIYCVFDYVFIYRLKVGSKIHHFKGEINVWSSSFW